LAASSIGDAAVLASGGNATDGGDDVCGCTCAEIGHEEIVPVTSCCSAIFAGMTLATGSRTGIARPSAKLIIPTANVTAPAVAKTVILRITGSPNRYCPFPSDLHDQPRLVNIQFACSARSGGKILR
jgi:hypothetical protein